MQVALFTLIRQAKDDYRGTCQSDEWIRGVTYAFVLAEQPIEAERLAWWSRLLARMQKLDTRQMNGNGQ